MNALRTGIVNLCLLILLLAALGYTANAQETGNWDEPLEISAGILNDSGQKAPTMSPVLAADEWGDVHMIFPVKTASGDSDLYDTLFYSRFSGGTWTEPTDIFFRQNHNFWQPQLAVDEAGWLHALWLDGSTALYSRARVENASSAEAWSNPVAVTEIGVREATMITGMNGSVHLAYCTSDQPGEISYVGSEDGLEWSRSIRVSRVGGCWARMAEDQQGRLHLVYSEQPGASAGSAVYYSRSEDSGISWSTPRELDSSDGRYLPNYGPSWINVATIGDNEIHVVWDGSPAGQRWHQVSMDGGETWSIPEQISEDHRGLTEPNAMAADSSSTLHMLSLGWLDTGSQPKGPYYTYWNGDRWAPFELIGNRTDWDPEGGSAAIVNGNQLVVGWRHETEAGNQVWVSHVSLDSPAILPKERPTPIIADAEATVNLIAAADSEAAEPVPTLVNFTDRRQPSRTSSSAGIFLATAAAALVVGIIVIIRLRSLSRRT